MADARSRTLAEQAGLTLAMQLRKVRRLWVFQFLVPILIAAGTVWLASRIARENPLSPEAAQRYVIGASFVAAMFGTISAVTNEVVWLRAQGDLEYLHTLPVSRGILLLGLIFLPICYALPGTLLVLWLGALLLHVAPQPSLLAVAAILAGQWLLTSVGALLGLTASRRVAATAAACIPLLVMLFSPVFVAPSALPSWLGAIGRYLPTTMIVDVMQHGLFGRPDARDWGELVIVVLIAAGVTLGLLRAPGWRGAR